MNLTLHACLDTYLDTYYPILSVIAASLVPTAVSGQHCLNQVESLQDIMYTALSQPVLKCHTYLLCE